MDAITLPAARTGIVTDTLSKMLDQFQHSPLQKAWVSAIAVELQLLETQAFALWLSMMLPYATGAQLDILGKIVGEKRYNRNDDDFRIAIASRVLINRGRGTVEDILATLSNALDRKYVLKQYAPAGLTVDVVGAVTEDEASALLGILKTIKGAGVSAALSYLTNDDEGLALSSDPDNVEIDSTAGLADDAGTTGGRLLEYIK